MRSRHTLTTTAFLAGLCAVWFLPRLAIADDLYDLGEYLSGDCTPCHQLKGNSPGIPPITGWDVDSFVMVMQAYKDGERNHALMQTVAKRFSNDDLKALAVFFGKQ